MVQGAFSCRSLFAKEPLIVGLFCGKWPMNIRHPMTPLSLQDGVKRHVLWGKSHGGRKESCDEERVRVSGKSHVLCNTLQHTSTHCNTLQHTATHCNTLQHTATHCNTLHRLYMHAHAPPLSLSLSLFLPPNGKYDGKSHTRRQRGRWLKYF